jgi:hypothetical protein
MNHMMSIARSAGQVCARYIAQSQLTSKALASTALILSKKLSTGLSTGCGKLFSKLRHAALTCGYNNEIDTSGTLQARALQGAHCEPPQRRARWVAAVIGIALSIVPSPISNGSNRPIQNVFQLADIQLTEKQEYCHDLITFKESSNNRYAVNGSHHGYYQGRSKALKGAPDDYQFYWYWSYVSHRYGITQYDEPNYCKALHHLRVKGWQ